MLGRARMKILFIDSKALFVSGLGCLLESAGLEFDGCYSKNIQASLGVLSREEASPDLILFDINLYDARKDVLAKEIRQLATFAPTIVISEVESFSFEKFIIKAGASGFVCKTNDKDILIDAIKTVLKGDIYGDCHKLGDSHPQSKNEIKVTSRQHEVLNLLSQGLLNKQIASELSISINTVNAHLHEIFNKLNVTNRTAAVESAHKIGLI